MDASGISTALIAHAALLKFSVLLLLLAAFLLAEHLRPHRLLPSANKRRGTNLLLAGIASASAAALVWAVPALAAVFLADWAAQQNVGALHWLAANSHSSGWRASLEIIVTLIALDFAIYWQHRFSHQVPMLWRLHRVHHSDTEFDVTLGLRFHPGEIVLSLLYKSSVVLLLGAPVIAVVIYELVLMSMALFTHANITLPNRLEQIVGRWLVTPELHRVHHSVEHADTNRNYGNWLSIWDRRFNSAAARRPDSACMPIGLPEYRAENEQTLAAILLNPLRANAR